MARALLILSPTVQTTIKQKFGWASEGQKIRGGPGKQGGRIWRLLQYELGLELLLYQIWKLIKGYLVRRSDC